jgi:hypothetical protein
VRPVRGSAFGCVESPDGEEPGGCCGGDEDAVDGSACDDSLLGKSSGQFQLPGAWNPEAYDIAWQKMLGKAQSMVSSFDSYPEQSMDARNDDVITQEAAGKRVILSVSATRICSRHSLATF